MSSGDSLRITSVFPGTFNTPAPDVPRLINTKSAFIERQADPSPRVDFTNLLARERYGRSLSTLLATHGESLATLVAPLLGVSAGQDAGATGGGADDRPRGMINLCKRKGCGTAPSFAMLPCTPTAAPLHHTILRAPSLQVHPLCV